MARRMYALKNGFASIDGDLVNLKEYKRIKKGIISAFESDENEDKFTIEFIPSVPSFESMENNVEGSVNYTYLSNEEEDFNADYEALIKALDS